MRWLAKTKGARPESAPPADVDAEAPSSLVENHYPGPEAPVK